MHGQPRESFNDSEVARAASLVEQADALIIATGAGMGVDSGLPDFRGKDGFWRAYPALKEAQLDFHHIASPAAFHLSPERAWGFYGHRLALYRETAPHPCPKCGGLARPNVLMLGDDGWLDRRSGSQGARQETWLSEVTRPVVIELGAGTAIPSVRHFSHRVIHEFGGVLIRINPNECNVPTRLDVGLRLGALAGLAAIAQVLGSEMGSLNGEDDDGLL